ncbi:MAG: DNA repair protein RecN [Actinobacteria bacterium]|nr:DNA repair protein RecN [Actinomycetota bacterium]
MLLELRVEGLGIVDELHLLLDDGLTAVTGETGAGKTLLVHALELLAGARADPGLVRDGVVEARVEGRFEHPDTGEETVLARIVPANGRSRAYVDGRLATAAELQELAVHVLDLHGQHAHQALLAPAAQRSALDAFAGEPARVALDDYRAARDAVRVAERALEALGGDERMRAREIALCEHQVSEIEAAGIRSADEDAALEAEEARLGDAAAAREALAAAYAAVEETAQDAAGVAAAALSGRTGLESMEQRLRAVQAELAELAHDLRAAADGVVEDPQRLDAVRARRRLLFDLQRKYGADLAEVLEFCSETAARLAELRAYEERAAAIEHDRAMAAADAQQAAQRLRAARVAAAGPLAEAVETRLVRLAMPGARLTVEVEAAEPGEDGADRVTFLLAANPGEPAAPLARVASGGELSRAMLALRTALMESDGHRVPGMLLFDEVDAGIGGEAGAAVGRELSVLARGAQVLCITHLAQVAAAADAQVVVRKAERDGRTTTTAVAVSGEERVAELSRMLAGVEGSEHARRHAEELLSDLGAR